MASYVPGNRTGTVPPNRANTSNDAAFESVLGILDRVEIVDCCADANGRSGYGRLRESACRGCDCRNCSRGCDRKYQSTHGFLPEGSF